MTWHTPDGDRVLTGAEGTLVRDVLAIVVDRISENMSYDDEAPSFGFGVRLFDSLTSTEHLALIKIVAEHLLTETADSLELTSVNESAVYAIFRTLATEIEIEIDTEDEPDMEGYGPEWKVYWRSRTLAAYDECFGNEVDEDFAEDDPDSSWMPPQDERSRNVEQWDSLTESLADRILWDRDFEMAGEFLDTDPAKAALMKQMLGIDAEYYSSVSADVHPERIDQTLRAVRQLTHRKPK